MDFSILKFGKFKGEIPKWKNYKMCVFVCTETLFESFCGLLEKVAIKKITLFFYQLAR